MEKESRPISTSKAHPTIDLVTQLKKFRTIPCCKVKDNDGRWREKSFNKDGKIYCKKCGKLIGDQREREEAFHQIFTYFLPTIYHQLQKLKYTNKLEAVQFIRTQLFRIVNNRNLRIDNGKLATMYISSTLDRRINNDHFHGDGDGIAESHCIKGLFVSQFRFRNAKKRYFKVHRKEPELEKPSDLKELCKIYNGDEDEVLTIAANLNNPMDSFQKKLVSGKNGDNFSLSDVIPDHQSTPEADCIRTKNSEMILERLNAILTPEQAELIQMYYLDNDELTKTDMAKKLGWKRFSKVHGKKVLDTNRIKNNLDAGKDKIKADPILREILSSL